MGCGAARKQIKPWSPGRAVGDRWRHEPDRQTERLRNMNALSRWDPFKEMDELQKRITSLFGLRSQRTTSDQEETMRVSQWFPLVDIVEDDKEYQIKLELPEVKKEAVNVTVESGVLSIRGERS